MNISGPWLILVWIALVAVIGRWLFRDARQRGRTPLAMLAMLLAFFPIGPLIWLMVRPPRLKVISPTAART